MQRGVLGQLHIGHLGIEKCQLVARGSVYSVSNQQRHPTYGKMMCTISDNAEKLVKETSEAT